MLGRVREAVADAAETLRRAFAGTVVIDLSPVPFGVIGRGTSLPQAVARTGLEPPLAVPRDMPRLSETVEGHALPPFQATLHAEAGWASWGVEAEVIRMTPLEAGGANRMGVPPLPRSAATQGRLDALAYPQARRSLATFGTGEARRLDPGLPSPRVEPGLEAMLGLAVPFRGQEIQRLPKGLWMRYSLQLVRGTGENVRNLEVLGLFRIPRKGVADLRHDPAGGRLLLRLEASALKAPRAPFILARRKDDGGLVSCFVEDP